MTAALVLAGWVAWAAPAARPATDVVHAVLESSVPTAGDTLAASPRDLILTFSGLVDEAGALVRLLGPGGNRWTLEARHPSDDTRTLTSPLPALAAGGYRVEWRVVSADGHAIAGDFVFFVANVTGGALSAPPAPTGTATPVEGAPVAGGEGASWVLVLTRTGANLALLLLAGTLSFSAWGAGDVTRTTASTARGLAVVAPILVSAYAWLWSGEALGGEAGPLDRVAGLWALTTGRALSGEVFLAWMVPWALLLARRPGIATAFALASVAAGGVGGHPASYTPLISLPASVVHMLAASAWVGGLLFLVTEGGAPSFVASARRVSAVALTAVALVTITGLVQSWILLGSFGRVTSSTFGLLVLAKVAGLAALVAFGAHHRLRLLPAATSVDGSTRLTDSVRRELVLAAFVVLVATILSHTPPNP